MKQKCSLRIIRKRIRPKDRYERQQIQYKHGSGQNRGDGDEEYRIYTHVLPTIQSLPASPLEESERLEQLRWLEAGLRIRVMLSDQESIGIDTPEDLKRLPL